MTTTMQRRIEALEFAGKGKQRPVLLNLGTPANAAESDSYTARTSFKGVDALIARSVAA